MKNYTCVGYDKKLEFDKPEPKFNQEKKISIILPTYNEEKNIKNLVMALRQSLRKTKYKEKFEIVVVDDNSKDRTPRIIDNLAEIGDFIAVHRNNHKGLFSAIQDGISISNGDFVLLMDSDFSHSPETIQEMVKHIDKYDLVSGSRFVEGGKMEAPFLRVLGSKVINGVCGKIMGMKIKDIAGGFHLIKKEKFNKLKFKYPSHFGEFDFELLYRAQKSGMKIKEIPFTYKFRQEGESKMGNLTGASFNAAKYFKRALQLRFGK